MKTTIRSIEAFPVGIPMLRGFRFASGSAGNAGDRAPHVFVKITDSEGRIGWGEGRPIPQWSYETLETVTTTIEDYLAPAVEGCGIWDRRGLHKRMFAAIGRGPSTGQPIAKAAVDIALHDLCAKAAGVPLRAFMGGESCPAEVPLSWTITAHSKTDAAKDLTEGLERGFSHFNFKAALSPGTDIEVAKLLMEEAPAHSFIWADANQGFTLPEAVAAAEAFREAGVDVLEQPFAADQRHLMEQLRERTGIALAVDEACVSPADFFHHVKSGLVDYLVIKPARSGGLLPTLQQAAVAESAGLGMLVSGLTESLLLKMASCQVAACLDVSTPAALNGGQFLDEVSIYPERETFEHDGHVHLGDRPGIGVEPNEEVLRDLIP